MPKIQPGPNIHIAALEKKKVEQANLMQPGPGTPWEDRGHLGTVKAFFATAGASLKAPVQLLNTIRRPETHSDARGYVIGCGIMWGLGSIVQAILWKWHIKEGWEHDEMWYRIGVGVLFVLSIGLVYMLHAMASAIMSKLNSAETGNRAPPVLTYNVLAYVLGPSILAPIPLIGPLVSLMWIVGLAIRASISRLRLKISTSIVNVLLTTVVVLVTLGAALLVAQILFSALIRYFE
jgi:hypothetical protein